MRNITVFLSLLFYLSSYSPVNAQLDCVGASTISCGQSVSVFLDTGTSNVLTYACNSWTDEGTEKVYEFTPNADGPFTAHLTSMSADLDVFILTACDENTCVGTVDSDSAYYANGVAGTTYYIVVDADQPQGGTADLEMICYGTPACNINVSVNATPETTPGANDGIGTSSATGATNYSFAYFDLTDTQVSGTNPATGLAPDDYYVVATDDDIPGCADTAYFTIDSASGPGCTLGVTVDVVAETAANANDGEATAVPTGAQGSVTYSWSNSETTETITGLSPATYGVTVTDSAGCTASASAVVDSFAGGNPCTINVTVTTIDETAANANDGEATANTTGEQGTVTYLWSNNETTQTITGLSPGMYTVTVTDTAGCTAVTTEEIFAFGNVPCSIDASATGTDETAANANDGEAIATTTGGQGTVTFLWSNNETTDTITGLAPGLYSVTATDTAGCTDSATVTILAFGAQPCAIDVSPTWTDETADNANDGVAIAVVAGNQGDYTILWSNNETTDTITGLAPGTYTVTATDTAGCVDVANVVIQAFDTSGGPGPFDCLLFSSGIITHTNELTPGGNNGTALALGVSPINGGITYAWSNGATTALNGPLAPGTYTVTISDSAGCSGTDTVEILAFGQNGGGNDSCLFTIQMSSSDVAVIGDSTGSAQVQVNGPNSTYNYTWSNGESGPVLNNLPVGSYSVSVTDDNGCERVGLATVNNPDTVEEPDGIEQLNLDNMLSLYPNPGNGFINIKLTENLIAKLAVVNSVGALVYMEHNKAFVKGQAVSLDLNLSPGVYYLQLLGANKEYFSKSFIVR